MHQRLSKVGLCFLAWQGAIAEHLQPQPLPHVPQHFDKRQLDGDLSFCYGDGSICVVGNDLWSDCEGLDNFDNLVPLYKCVCGNGYVSVEDA